MMEQLFDVIVAFGLLCFFAVTMAVFIDIFWFCRDCERERQREIEEEARSNVVDMCAEAHKRAEEVMKQSKKRRPF